MIPLDCSFHLLVIIIRVLLFIMVTCLLLSQSWKEKYHREMESVDCMMVWWFYHPDFNILDRYRDAKSSFFIFLSGFAMLIHRRRRREIIHRLFPHLFFPSPLPQTPLESSHGSHCFRDWFRSHFCEPLSNPFQCLLWCDWAINKPLLLNHC